MLNSEALESYKGNLFVYPLSNSNIDLDGQTWS